MRFKSCDKQIFSETQEIIAIQGISSDWAGIEVRNSDTYWDSLMETKQFYFQYNSLDFYYELELTILPNMENAE